MKIKSLNRKVAAALFALIGALSIFYIVVAVQSTQLYQQEIQQKLNRTLADHIAKDIPLIAQGSTNQDVLEELFHTLMIVNPSIELYLVDADGSVLAFNAPPGKVQLNSIEMSHVHEFLDESTSLPIRGTDPRNPDRAKVFSASPIYEDERLVGYLYIVLGGENYDTVVEMIQESYILKLLFWIGLSAFILSLFAGIATFGWLTTRIKRISAGVGEFKDSEFESAINLLDWNRQSSGDEIDMMGTTIEEMSAVIIEQFAQLRQSDITRRELIANISHDLRTPLTSMQGYLETLQIKQAELTAEDRDRYVGLAIKQSRRLRLLISDLFELAVLESPDSKVNFEQFSFPELLQDVIQKFELKTAQKQLAVSCDMPEHAPFVSGDIAMIERVLENLIENAIKFSPEGGSIQVSVKPVDENLEISVTDSGIGIAADEIPNLFQRFYRVDKSRSDQTHSNGLGLAIAHRILQLHDGAISVTSMPGEGSCFSFNLPVAV